MPSDCSGCPRSRKRSTIPRCSRISSVRGWSTCARDAGAALDRGDKLTVYASEGVPHVWFVDPEALTLEVLELDGPSYRVRNVYADKAVVRAVPFDAIELDLSLLWSR